MTYDLQCFCFLNHSDIIFIEFSLHHHSNIMIVYVQYSFVCILSFFIYYLNHVLISFSFNYHLMCTFASPIRYIFYWDIISIMFPLHFNLDVMLIVFISNMLDFMFFSSMFISFYFVISLMRYYCSSTFTNNLHKFIISSSFRYHLNYLFILLSFTYMLHCNLF